MHAVKVKCTEQKDTGDYGRKSRTLLVQGTILFKETEEEVAKYFDQFPGPEKNYFISGINNFMVHDIFYGSEDQDPDELEFFKIKVSVLSSTEEKPTTQNFLVQAENVKQAMARVETSFKGTSFDITFKTTSTTNIKDVIVVERPTEESNETESEKGLFKLEEEDDDFDTE